MFLFLEGILSKVEGQKTVIVPTLTTIRFTFCRTDFGTGKVVQETETWETLETAAHPWKSGRDAHASELAEKFHGDPQFQLLRTEPVSPVATA